MVFDENAKKSINVVSYPSDVYPYSDNRINYNRLEYSGLSYDILGDEIYVLYPFSHIIKRYDLNNKEESVVVPASEKCCDETFEANTDKKQQDVAKFFYSVPMYTQIKVINEGELFFLNFTYGPQWRKGYISKEEKKSVLILTDGLEVLKKYIINNQENYYLEFGKGYFLIRQNNHEDKSIFTLYKYPDF